MQWLPPDLPADLYPVTLEAWRPDNNRDDAPDFRTVVYTTSPINIPAYGPGARGRITFGDGDVFSGFVPSEGLEPPTPAPGTC